MVLRHVLTGNWNEVSNKLKQRWGELIDDDLRDFSGSVEQLVGEIQRKTGDTRAEIEEYLNDIGEQSSTGASRLAKMVQAGASRSAERGYDAIRRRYSAAERTIRRRPAQSFTAAFGLGLAGGIGLALLFRAMGSSSVAKHGRAVTESCG